jgi:hypothetical protein
MSEAGAATFNSSITANAGVVVDNITIDGTEIDLSSGDLTIDVAGDIILDADGADVSFRDAGTGHLSISNSSNDAVITSLQTDKDMIFKGVDGGALITALTLDMSDAGTAIFNHDISLADNNKALFGDDGDFEIYHSGLASIVREAGAGNLVLAGNDVNITNGAMNETHIDCNNNGSVDLYHDNSIKIQTSATGATVTGVLVSDGLTIGSAAITEAELEILDGATVTTSELNFSDGVTSNIQTQLDTKTTQGFALAMAVAL